MNYSRDDVYLFNTGNAQKAYLTFGCHRVNGTGTYRFCLWAPNAKAVFLIGDFNGWDESSHPMEPVSGGVFTLDVEGLGLGVLYKYLIHGYDGELYYKADPFAFYSELRPGTASRIWELDGFGWSDQHYIEARDEKPAEEGPVSIYEMHLGSWKGLEEGSGRFPNYRDIADELAPYLKKMGFTHVELLPVTEHPLDMSWGYQVTGYYSVTSRYGTPQDFMYFVDRLHREGVGVILDWVPAHFPKDAPGLRKFDGTCLYEHEDPRQGEQKQWGTLIFNYGRPEVQSFLISSAMFFADVYHVDGIRIDAVSAMLYLDFGKQEGEYIKNKYGNNINLEAIEFLRKLNQTLRINHKGFLSIAEESTAYPFITRPTEDGGLGFHLKWNMGFMHDMLFYMDLDPLFRKSHHGALTFSMEYAFSEHYVLPFSHDEVVHGKRSMVDKMFGSYEMKFESLRTLYGYMYAHPGKKLLFMGDEFAQFVEWNYQKNLDWMLPEEYESHRGMQSYVKGLNYFYKEHRAFYEIEDSWDGFRWLNQKDEEFSAAAFMRISKPEEGHSEKIVCIFNFTPVERINYRIHLPGEGSLRELLNSSECRFGGYLPDIAQGGKDTLIESGKETAEEGTEVSEYDYAEVTLPPLSAVYLEYIEKKTGRNSYDCKKEMCSDAIGRRSGEQTVCTDEEES